MRAEKAIVREDENDDCEISPHGYHEPVLVCFAHGDEVICDQCGIPLSMTVEEYLR